MARYRRQAPPWSRSAADSRTPVQEDANEVGGRRRRDLGGCCSARRRPGELLTRGDRHAGADGVGGGRRDGPRLERQSRRSKSNGGQEFRALTTVGVEGRCRRNPGTSAFRPSPRPGRSSPVSPDHHRRHRHLRGRLGLRTPLRESDNRRISVDFGARVDEDPVAVRRVGTSGGALTAGPSTAHTRPRPRGGAASPAGGLVDGYVREAPADEERAERPGVGPSSTRGARPHRVALLTCQAVAVVRCRPARSRRAHDDGGPRLLRYDGDPAARGTGLRASRRRGRASCCGDQHRRPRRSWSGPTMQVGRRFGFPAGGAVAGQINISARIWSVPFFGK